LEPDKNKIYICSSSSISQSFHLFLCADGKCSGLYPNPNTFLGLGPGYIMDDTKDFDCKELNQSKPTCNKEEFKQCILKFVNSKQTTNRYPYNYITNNCQRTGGMVAFMCQLENGCW